MKKIILGLVIVISAFLFGGLFRQVEAASCVVTISGNKYDVSSLQNSHSGGNVFVCGTDMTSAYLKRHGADLNRMKAYLIPAPASASSPEPKPAVATSSKPNTNHIVATSTRATLQSINKQYTTEKKALENKQKLEKQALEKKQNQEKKALELKYQKLRSDLKKPATPSVVKVAEPKSEKDSENGNEKE